MGRPVVDKTGTDGEVVFELMFVEDAAAVEGDTSLPDFLTVSCATNTQLTKTGHNWRFPYS